MRLLSVNRYSIPMRRFQGVKKLFVRGSNPNELPHRRSTTLWNPVLGGRIAILAGLVTAMPAWIWTNVNASIVVKKVAVSPSGLRNCETSSCEGCEVRFVESE